LRRIRPTATGAGGSPLSVRWPSPGVWPGLVVEARFSAGVGCRHGCGRL